MRLQCWLAFGWAPWPTGGDELGGDCEGRSAASAPPSGSFLTAGDSRRRVPANGSGNPTIRPDRYSPTPTTYRTGQQPVIVSSTTQNLGSACPPGRASSFVANAGGRTVDFMITHAPGHMFVTDLKDERLTTGQSCLRRDEA
jgi:hypothetical protein